MNVLTTPFQIENGRGWPILGDVRVPGGSGPLPVVAICHGFKGWKDWSFLPWVAERLALRGFATVAFSLSTCGVRAGDTEIEDLARFAEKTITRDVDDLSRVITAVFEHVLEPRGRFSIYRIGVLGYSAGGSLALAHASLDTRVKAVCALSPLARFEALAGDRAIDAWEREGRATFVNDRNNRELWLDRAFLKDLVAHRETYTPDIAVQRLAVPYLLLHGDADRTIPIEHSRRLFFANAARSSLETIDGADHVYGATHPFDGPTPALERAVELATSFFRTELLRARP